MKPFQLAAVAFFLCMVLVYMRRAVRRELPVAAAALLSAFWLAAIAIVLWHERTSELAQRFGIGRGADLILYVSSIALFALATHLYLRVRHHEHEITVLTRRLALLEAQPPADAEPGASPAGADGPDPSPGDA